MFFPATRPLAARECWLGLRLRAACQTVCGRTQILPVMARIRSIGERRGVPMLKAKQT